MSKKNKIIWAIGAICMIASVAGIVFAIIKKQMSD